MKTKTIPIPFVFPFERGVIEIPGGAAGVAGDVAATLKEPICFAPEGLSFCPPVVGVNPVPFIFIGGGTKTVLTFK